MIVDYDEPPDGPDFLLYTAAEAERELGIPAGTVRAWASRERIWSFGLDRCGRPMYRARDLIGLRDGRIRA